MKKILLLSACAALVLGVASCNKNRQRIDDTQKTDSVAVEAAAPAAPLTSADLHLFGLHGNVKHVTCNTGGLSAWPISATNLDFDEQGNLVNADLKVATIRNGNNTSGKFKRDEQGRIKSFDDSNKGDENAYFWYIEYDQYGGIKTLHSDGMDYAADSEYTCDENGFVLNSSVETAGEGGFLTDYKRTYEYPEKDAQGNWTKLIVTEKTTDSEFNSDTNKYQVTGTHNRTYTVTRTITYY